VYYFVLISPDIDQEASHLVGALRGKGVPEAAHIVHTRAARSQLNINELNCELLLMNHAVFIILLYVLNFLNLWLMYIYYYTIIVIWLSETKIVEKFF